MNVELLIVGNEILIGKTLDRNSNWLAKKITKYGHKVRRIITVSDDIEQISNVLREILSHKPDIVIISGGLGPTYDDLTLIAVAQALSRELELDKHAYNMVKKSYEQAYERGLLKLQGMTKEREKMAYLPKGAIPLKNLRGTSPGVKIFSNNTLIFCLPGIHIEMKMMFKNSIKEILKEKAGKFIEKGFLIEGIGESQIAPYTTDLKDRYPQLWIKTHPRFGLSIEVEISITSFNVENGEELTDKALNEIRAIILNLNGKIKERKQ